MSIWRRDAVRILRHASQYLSYSQGAHWHERSASGWTGWKEFDHHRKEAAYILDGLRRDLLKLTKRRVA